MNYNHTPYNKQNNSITHSKLSSRFGSMRNDSIFASVSPLKNRCFTVSKSKIRKPTSKLFTAAHQIKNSETFLPPHSAGLRKLSKSADKTKQLNAKSQCPKNRKMMNIVSQFSINVQGEDTLSMIIEGFEQGKGMGSTADKWHEQIPQNLLRTASQRSLVSVIYSLGWQGKVSEK